MSNETRNRGMKRKTIKAVLRKRFDEFLSNVRNEDVRKVLAEKSIITGGAIASMLLGEGINDLDVYLTDFDACRAVAEHYAKEFKANPPPRFSEKYGNGTIPIDVYVDEECSPKRVKIVVKSAGAASENGDQGYEYFEANDVEGDNAAAYAQQVVEESDDDGKKPKFRPVFLSTNAISLSNKVQVVCRFYGEPAAIHENYDFVHCTNWWRAKDGHLELRPAALEVLLSRELKYVGSKYPLCSFIRTRKFIARGWTINAGQFLKMAWQLNELNLKDPKVLEDQLTGVDAAYFEEIIRLLKERMAETNTKEVDATYLMELVDRMF